MRGVVLFALLGAGCLHDPAAGGLPEGVCRANSDCGAGRICDAAACVVICSADTDCEAAEICDVGLCGAGERVVPVILSVDGDSSESMLTCPDATVGRRCIADGLFVEGSSLDGAQWQLDSSVAGSVLLAAFADSTDTRAHIELPASLAAGDYRLTASNRAGSADQMMTVLQGLPGADGATGPAGSPDTPAEVLAKLRMVDGAGSGLDADTLDGSELADLTAQVDGLQTQIDVLAGGGIVPPGSVVAWAGGAAPGGWVRCDGTAYDSNNSAFAPLFAAIGCTYGCSGSDFNVPDLRRRFPVGRANGGGASTLGATGGAWDHGHTVNSHGHSTSNHNHSVPNHVHTDGTHTHTMGAHNHRWGYFDSNEDWWGYSFSGSTPTLMMDWGNGIDNAGTGIYPVAVNGAGTRFFYTRVDVLNSSGTGATSLTTNSSGATTSGNANASVGSASPGTDTANPPYIVLNYIIKL